MLEWYTKKILCYYVIEIIKQKTEKGYKRENKSNLMHETKCCTVWDRVPKEDAANFESDTFLWFAYVVNISKIETFLGRFWIFG